MMMSQPRKHGRSASLAVLLLLGVLAPTSTAFAFSSKGTNNHHQVSAEASRRNFLQGILIAGTTAAISAPPAFAADDAAGNDNDNDSDNDNTPIEVYFGCGCFWHVQHEFVEAERRILGRSDSELTARAGYAGGRAGAKNGKVCYHNAAQVSDYGSLGHAEVVRLNIPAWSYPEFCVEYCNLFSKEGYRPDQFGDTGPEYRNLVGVPGGDQSTYAQQLVKASQSAGDKLDFAKGKGDDPDRRALCFVMDTADFPFFVAEQYHQFHDGFNFGENYPQSYNNLAAKLAKEGKLGRSDCPNGLIGIGALGL